VEWQLSACYDGDVRSAWALGRESHEPVRRARLVEPGVEPP